LLVEKLPFFLLSAGSCAITLVAQRAGGALVSVESVSLGARIANALVAYVRYLGKLVWPRDLAVVYPNVMDWPTGLVLLAGLALVVFTALALWRGRERGYLPVGWFWYLGTLVPTIGLVKVGDLAMADRYTYLPAIGLFILFAWGLADVTARWRWRTMPLAAAAVVMLAAGASLARAQLRCWQDTESLFRHALAVTEKNPLAHINLGFYYSQRGRPEQAGQHYQAALEANPNFAEAWNGLGFALAEQKKFAEAVPDYEAALRLKPQLAEARINLGNALFYMGKTNEAVEHLQAAVKLKPEDAVGHFNLGCVLYAGGRVSEALEQYRIALRLDPRLVSAHHNLGSVLARQGKAEEAMAHYREALRINPQYAPAYQDLAGLLAEQGRFPQAAEYYRAALKLEPDNARLHLQLALVLTAQRDFKQAVAHYRLGLPSFKDAPEVLNNLAWILATNPDAEVRDGAEAVALAESACRLTGSKQAVFVGTLAAAYAEAGRFNDAVAAAEKARSLAEAANERELAARNLKLSELYRAGKPCRDPQ
jgi:tetratricopeptide (TPR) repeat protein